jgi:hypothetical protein
MSWFADGDSEVVGGLARGSNIWRFKVRLGETVRVVFLDDTEIELPHPEKEGKTITMKSPFKFGEHQYRTAQRYENFLTCVAPAQGLDACAGCSQGDVPRKRAAFTVMVSGHKKKDGTPLPQQVQLLVTDIDSTAYQSIMKRKQRLEKEGQSLRGATFEVSRLGKTAQSACAQGTTYEFEGFTEIPPEAELINYFEEFAPPKSKKDAETLLSMRVTDDGPSAPRPAQRARPAAAPSQKSSRYDDDDDVVDYD